MKNKQIVFMLAIGLASASCALYAQPDYPPPPPPDEAMQAPPDAPQDGYQNGYADTQNGYADTQNGYADASAGVDVSGDVFYNELSPYGQWVNRDGYGQVWVPRVAAGWRPYTTGHWVYTDDGWAWVADEQWGWAAFHYGRWFYDDSIGGWAWVPGNVWAPAWVAWRSGGGYVGWAPLPPTVGFSFGVGLEIGGDVNFGLRAEHFYFVAENAILEPRLATVIVAPSRNVTIINNTTNITNITVVNNRVVNRGVPVQHIEQVTGRPVPRLHVTAMASASGGARTQVRGGAVAFYQPPAIQKAARQNRPEFGKAGVPVAAQPKAAQARGRNTGQGQGQTTTTNQQTGGRRVNGQAQPPAQANPNPTRDSRTHNSSPSNTAATVDAQRAAAANTQDLQRRHQAEQSQLAAQQAAERKQLQSKHQTERAQPPPNTNANDLARQHAAEQRALDQQHKQQQQELQARHQQEAKAAQKPPPPKQQDKERKPPSLR